MCIGINFDEFVAHPHADERQTGADAAGDEDLKVEASFVEEETECGQGGRCVNPVPVVEDDHHLLTAFVYPVDERGQHVPFGLGTVLLEFLTQFAG